MNRIAKPGLVCRWANHKLTGTFEEATLIAAGMKLTAMIDISARPWGTTGIRHFYDEDLYLLRYAGDIANGRMLWKHGYSATNDIHHPTVAIVKYMESLQEQGINYHSLTPEEQTDIAFTAWISGSGGGDGSAGGIGSSPENPWPRTSKPRDQSAYAFVYFSGQTKPWQYNRWGEPETYSPEWIEAVGGVVFPPVEPPEPPEPPVEPPTDPPVDPPVNPPSNREMLIKLMLMDIESVIRARLP